MFYRIPNSVFPVSRKMCVIDDMKDFENRKGGWRRVFICCPFDPEDIESERALNRYFHYALEHECVPVASNIYYSLFLDETDDAERSQIFALSMMDMMACDEVWVFGRDYTDEMMGQIALAMTRGKTVRYFRNLEQITDKDEEVEADE